MKIQILILKFLQKNIRSLGGQFNLAALRLFDRHGLQNEHSIASENLISLF